MAVCYVRNKWKSWHDRRRPEPQLPHPRLPRRASRLDHDRNRPRDRGGGLGRAARNLPFGRGRAGPADRQTRDRRRATAAGLGSRPRRELMGASYAQRIKIASTLRDASLPQPAETPARFEPTLAAYREAAGVTVDDDEDQWRRLTGSAKRDLAPLTQQRMQELA